jgi:hypothetical protein
MQAIATHLDVNLPRHSMFLVPQSGSRLARGMYIWRELKFNRLMKFRIFGPLGGMFWQHDVLYLTIKVPVMAFKFAGWANFELSFALLKRNVTI